MSRRKDLKKQKDVDFIRGFKKITVKSICKELGIPDSNIATGTSSGENYKRLRIEIEDRLARLYLKHEV